MQEAEVWTYEQIVYAQHRICPTEWDTQIPLGFSDTNGSPNLGQMTRSYNNQEKRKEENWQNCEFCFPGGPQSKIERKWHEGYVLRPC